MPRREVADTVRAPHGITFEEVRSATGMAHRNHNVTKILFIDSDDIAFQVSQCIAKVVAAKLPPVELYHAHDATEGLQMLENIKPDVIVIDDQLPEERDLFLDSLSGNHPPVLIQTERPGEPSSLRTDRQIIHTPRGDSLDGIKQLLVLATAIADRSTTLQWTGDKLH